jgi:hypothetical protein
MASPLASRDLVVARPLGKAAAAGVVICAVLHVPVLLMHLSSSIALTLLMGIAALVCLSCVPDLVRGPMHRTWATCGLLSGAMLILHLTLVLSQPVGSGPSSSSPVAAHSLHQTIPPAALDVGHTGHMSAAEGGLFLAATATSAILALLSAVVVRRANRSVPPGDDPPAGGDSESTLAPDGAPASPAEQRRLHLVIRLAHTRVT